MRYDEIVEFYHTGPTKAIDGVSHHANITQMGLDQTIAIFGDAKQRPFVVRLPFATDIRTGYLKVASLPFDLQITQAIKHDNRTTTLIGVEYHGRL